MQSIDIPQKVNILEILKNKTSLSPHNYKKVNFGATKTKPLVEFVLGDLIRGEEVGSDAYISKSYKFFIRNKALQADSFTFNFSGESVVPILPNRFIDLSLKEGEVIISKDSNIGEVIILDRDYPDHMLSGGLIKISVEPKYYLFAFLKNDLFKTQVGALISKGATIKHAKKLFLDALIPSPNQKNTDDVFQYFEVLVKAVVNKEKQIREKRRKILELIGTELLGNQNVSEVFKYHFPTIGDLLRTGRIDAGIYSHGLKRNLFYIENYSNKSQTLRDLNFKPRRGPNLAVSVIGRSIYSSEYMPNFYRLIEPVDISDYMTVREYRWLGNKTSISTLKRGDILFGAEGSIGKIHIFCEHPNNTITNYHGMSINRDEFDLTNNIFVGCFLLYLKEQGVLDKISIGGQGGSVGKEAILELKIPLFPSEQKQAVAQLYYNPFPYKMGVVSVENFEEKDKNMGSRFGILELDAQIKTLKKKINSLVNTIVSGKEIDINFDFIHDF